MRRGDGSIVDGFESMQSLVIDDDDHDAVELKLRMKL